EKEYVNEGALKLAQEAAEKRAPPGLGQGIRPVAGEPGSSLFRCQPGFGHAVRHQAVLSALQWTAGSRTTSTVHFARAATAAETLPRNIRLTRPTPRAPMKMQSAFHSSAWSSIRELADAQRHTCFAERPASSNFRIGSWSTRSTHALASAESLCASLTASSDEISGRLPGSSSAVTSKNCVSAGQVRPMTVSTTRSEHSEPSSATKIRGAP